MPHYKDGTEAKPGDLVKGKGYVLKDENGELREIVGIIRTITPDAAACNVSLIVPEQEQEPSGTFILDGACYYSLRGVLEYGQADHFEKVG